MLSHNRILPISKESFRFYKQMSRRMSDTSPAVREPPLSDSESAEGHWYSDIPDLALNSARDGGCSNCSSRLPNRCNESLLSAI